MGYVENWDRVHVGKDWAQFDADRAAGQANSAAGKTTPAMTPAKWAALAKAVAAGGASYLSAMDTAKNEKIARKAASPKGMPTVGATASAKQISASQGAAPTQESCTVAYTINGNSADERATEHTAMPPMGFSWTSDPVAGWVLQPSSKAQADAINANGWGM